MWGRQRRERQHLLWIWGCDDEESEDVEDDQAEEASNKYTFCKV